MKLTFTEIASCSHKFDYSNLSKSFNQVFNARAGNILFERQPDPNSLKTSPNSEDKIALKTPAVVNYTKFGLQPHTLPDMESKQYKPSINQVFLEHFIEHNDSPLLTFKEGLHPFLALDSADKILLLDALDHSHVNRTSYVPSNSFVQAETSGGLRKINTEFYSTIINTQNPDIYIPISDHIFMSISDAEKGKRIKKSVDRSISWITKINDQIKNRPVLFLPLMGSTDKASRERFLESVSSVKYSGVVICDYGIKPSLFKQLEIANYSLSCVDTNLPRYLVGFSAPDEVVVSVQNGIDLFSSIYPYSVTEQGRASTYTFFVKNLPGEESPSNESSINLFDPKYKDDFKPISSDCSCYTCSKHTRAYIYHLLSTQEMLATVLLQSHNVHVYLEFFKDIRKSISDGTFADDSISFLNYYSSKFSLNTSTDPTNTRSLAFNEISTFDPKKSTPTTKEKIKRFTQVE
ncbi:hypothetical protein BB560_005540 [Smittium megazygosporum]|uniref:Queuine tRNA-ribosyltransferase accessory subunit 2 n=1 Tax=Smittium megazygosporum TaxID=133381 RepID=A0A2T9Z3T3_9FUNG|nr:hypothetical protein BB560_005540 [Smittium megazygosporum]